MAGDGGGGVSSVDAVPYSSMNPSHRMFVPSPFKYCWLCAGLSSVDAVPHTSIHFPSRLPVDHHSLRNVFSQADRAGFSSVDAVPHASMNPFHHMPFSPLVPCPLLFACRPAVQASAVWTQCPTPPWTCSACCVTAARPASPTCASDAHTLTAGRCRGELVLENTCCGRCM